MSRSGDLTAIVLDVGPSISTRLPSGSSNLETAVKAISYFVQQKVLHTKRDQVALITFGTNDTDNALASGDEYQNIVLNKGLSPPDLDLLRLIESEVAPGDAPTDFVDALIVGLDVLINTSAKGSKKLYMFTDAGAPVNDSNLDQIIEGINANDIDLRVVGVGIDEDEEDDDDVESQMTPVQKKNVSIIKKIVSAVDGETYSFTSAYEILSQFRKRVVNPTTTFRGCLAIADLKIPVHLYSEIKREPRPTLKKLSALVTLDPTDADSGKVDRDVVYTKVTEDEEEVAKDDLIKGYKYGRTIVPWEKMHEDNLGYKPDKDLTVICFTHESNVPRHLQKDTLLCLLPPNNDPVATNAIATLATSLHESNSVAVARYVFRNKAAPKLGIIFPNITPTQRGLYFTTIPFHEDVRPYEFTSLSNVPAARFSPDQKDAVTNLINSMDLMQGYVDEDGDAVEAFKPELTYNPSIQMFYQSVHYRAMHPNEPLPPLEESLANYIRPSEKITKDAKGALDEVINAFPLIVRSRKGKKTAAEIFSAEDDAAENAAKKSKGTADQQPFSMAALMKVEVTEVGSATPVEDFKAIISADKAKLAVAAKQLIGRVQDLVDLYTGGDVGKFTQMMAALRQETLLTEPEIFNGFLRELVSEIRQLLSQRQPFLDELRANNLTLISSAESSCSDVPQLDADRFFSDDASGTEDSSSAPAPVADDDDDDLMDEL